MKIKCIKNKISPKILVNYSSSSLIPLIINKEYLVYAVSEYFQNTWFCICDESYTYYPTWTPHDFFQLVDNRISRYWIFSFKKDLDKKRFFLGVPEWATQQNFYDNLTDGKEKESQIFKSYKELLDLEFPNPFISESAQIVDEKWLMCESCIDAWQYNSVKDALVRCPKCRKILNNPRYKQRNRGVFD